MTSTPPTSDAALELVLAKWLIPLDEEKQQKIHQQLERNQAHFGALASEDQTAVNPAHAALTEAAKQWLAALYGKWNGNFTTAKKSFDAAASAITTQSMTLDALDAELDRLCQASALTLFWSHPRTKTKVRGAGKEAFMQSSLLQDVNLFDIPAVLAALTEEHASPEAAQAQRDRIASALDKLGHFTSKPIHTSAQAVGVTLPPNASAVGPYLTAGLLIAQKRLLWLDQAVNDNTGQAIGYLEILNGTSQEDSPATLDLVKQVADQYFAQGRAHGTDAIDPRLRQIVLPASEGQYRAITPLASMGLSAYLHSHWQDWLPVEPSTTPEAKQSKKIRASHGQAVSYGFSSTAINNFTAIRKVQHQHLPEREVGNLPNRVLLFEVPSLDEAHRTLASILHQGYRLYLPERLKETLFKAYRHAGNALINVDSASAIEIEKRLQRPAMHWLASELHRIRDLCADALDAMDDSARIALLESQSTPSEVVQFFLGGLTQEAGRSVSTRELSEVLARLLYKQVAQIADGKEMLGLSVIDRQRFMRWAPGAITQAIAVY